MGGGSTAKYKHVRGPDGSRYAAWKEGLRRRVLERYGLDVKAPDGRPDPDTVRVMRNARKRERQQARRPRTFWQAVKKYIAHKYDERNLP